MCVGVLRRRDHEACDLLFHIYNIEHPPRTALPNRTVSIDETFAVLCAAPSYAHPQDLIDMVRAVNPNPLTLNP